MEDIIFKNFLISPLKIRNDFHKIWNIIIDRTGLNLTLSKNLMELKNLVVYDVLDGNRSTLITNSLVGDDLESILYAINFIHTMKALGGKNCYLMVHTSYNRERGEKEFKLILDKVSFGVNFIKKYAIQNNIRCFCIGHKNGYENINLINDLIDSTKNGEFHSYFLVNYDERWIFNKMAQDILKNLPLIDVYIRHTKYHMAGGWIPEIMSRSVFLYAQNGTKYSNWKYDEMIVLIALALLAKLLHKGESLKKTYQIEREIEHRHLMREVELFNKKIFLREHPKKLFIVGSANGIYQFYY